VVHEKATVIRQPLIGAGMMSSPSISQPTSIS